MKNIKTYIILLLVQSIFLKVAGQERKLNLKEAVQLALTENRWLKNAELEKDKSSLKIKETRGLALPSINITGQYLDFFQKQVSFLPGNFVGLSEDQIAVLRVGGKHSFVGSVNLVQPLFQPAVPNQIRAAGIADKVTEQSLLSTRNNVVTATKKAYLNVLIAVEQEKLIRQSISRNQRALKDARSLLAQGRASRADTLRAFVSLENLQPELRKWEQEINIQKILLRQVIGLNENENLSLTDSLFYSPLLQSTADTAGIPLWKSRPEIQGLTYQEQLQEVLVHQAIFQRLPQLNLVGSIIGQTQANDLKFNKYTFPASSYVGLQLQIPVFSGLRNIYSTKIARVNKHQVSTQLENAKSEVATQVQVNALKLKEAESRVSSQQVVVNAAQLMFQLISDRYKQGISSRLELTDAELSLTLARSNYLRSVYDYSIAGIDLEHAVGKISE